MTQKPKTATEAMIYARDEADRAKSMADLSGMVERVARALAAEEGYFYDPIPYNRRAGAAIEAMRDIPADLIETSWGFGVADWNQVIDAALKASPPPDKDQ